ncbi:MAG: 50S ribosomal protein L13 [Gemmatimonadetes bacterium]|nr:MAG: 50S ribosomal protein L13 [Gemmatimonadota bacterium]
MAGFTVTGSLKDVENKKWYVVDAEGMVLGRLATEVARILRGKHKPTYSPHMDVGDFVIVINADKVVLTGRKLDQKVYTRYSGYPGGLRKEVARHLMDRKPTEVVRRAVWGMLPHNRLGRRMVKKLKIYAGADHPHHAQMPETLSLTT